MQTKKIRLDEEFDKFWKKIEKNENFALVRYGDGEQKVMAGKSIRGMEGWIAPSYQTSLSRALREAFSYDHPNFYQAISCPCCDQNSYYWYSSRSKNIKNTTFANLFVNKNYPLFKKRFESLNRDAIVIGNAQGKNEKIGNLNVLKYYSVEDNCIEYWDQKSDELLQRIIDETADKKNILFIVAAGPMSCPIIYHLFKNNPDNCYLDLGSSIDCYIHKKRTRSYQKKYSRYHERNCWMYDPQEVVFDTTVVMNLYKRPHCLEKQLLALESQSLKPKKILIFHDQVPSGDRIELPEHLKKRFDIIEVAEKNVGVWGRFNLARQAQTTYSCVFDDDTIPGHRWLESCHRQMQEQEGLYGANGIILLNPRSYPDNIISFGWKNPNSKRLKVDFVGHSWFFKTSWLEYLFQAPQSVQSLKNCGEDMSFSYQLQKNLNISTFVPPHQYADFDFYGSLPQYARKYGGASEALSADKNNIKSYNMAINKLLDQDYEWKLVYNKKNQNFKFLKFFQKFIHLTIGIIPFTNLRRKLRANSLIYFFC